MIIITSICIDKNREFVWDSLFDLEKVGFWVKDIKAIHYRGEQTKGIGTIRVCDLANGKQSVEKFVEWDEGHSFTYQTISAPMMAFAQNKWNLEEVNGKTLVTSNATIIFKGGVLGKLLSFIFQPLAHKSMQNYLKAFKYLVETGYPYDGK